MSSALSVIGSGRGSQHQQRLRERPSSGSSKDLERRRRLWNWHAQVLDELRQVPCADCGERFPPCAMDFDHRDGTDKRVGVTRMVGRAGIKTDPRRSRQVRYRVRELPPGADVSSALERLSSGSSSVGGASAFQAECRGFESRLPLQLPRYALSGPARHSDKPRRCASPRPRAHQLGRRLQRPPER